MAKKVQLEVEIKGNDSVAQASEKTKALRDNIQKLKETLATGGLGEKEYQKANDQLQKYEDKLKKSETATKNLKTQLRELQTDLQSGKLTGKEFDEGVRRAAAMKDQIKDVNNRVNALATDGADVMLKGFGDMATGIIGGFTAAQGAMALFGSENEDLQKTMVKLQGATALLNGLQAVNNTLQGDSAAAVAKTSVQEKIATFVKGRYAAAIGKSTGAMKLFRIAGAALGIGAVIAIITLLINNFDKLRNIVLKFVPQLAGLGEVFTNVKNAIMDFLGFSSEAERQQEKSIETDKAKSKSMQREIDLMEAQGQSVEAIYKKKKELMELDLKALKIAKEKAGASQEETDAYEDALNAIAVLDAQETKRKQDLVDKENEEASKKRKEQAKKKEEEAKKEFEDNKKTAIQKAKDAQRDLVKKFEEEQKAIKDDKKAKQDIADEAEEIREQKEIEANQKYGELIEQRRIDDLSVRDKELFDIEQKYLKEQELALGNASLLAEIETDKNNALALKKKEFAEQDAAIQKEIDLVRLDAITSTANQASQLLNQVAGKNKALATSALAVEKGAAIADVIIKGIRERAAITLRYAGNLPAATPELVLSKVRTGIAVASIAASGIQGARAISSGGGSGGGSVQPPNIRGSQTTNEPTSQPATKVFVTETDIRSVTRKVDGIFSQATIQ